MRIIKTFLLFNLIILSTLLTAQDTSDVNKQNVYGVNIGAAANTMFFNYDYWHCYNYNLDFTIDKGKSKFGFGIDFGPKAILYNYAIDKEEKRKQALHGIHSFYQIFPQGKQRSINFFFFSSLCFLYYKDDGIERSNQVPYSFSLSSLRFHFGHGVNIRISDAFYFNSMAGVGATLKEEKFNSKVINKDSSFESDIIIKIGFGYKFGTHKNTSTK